MLKFLNKIIFWSLLFFSVPVFAVAAEIKFDLPTTPVISGSEFKVDVVVNTTEPLNAIEGQLVFPPDLLDLVDIQDGNSMINFWAQKPSLISAGVVSFSGITPGGFSGNNKILTLVFLPKTPGSASLSFKNTVALKNDGLGTAASFESRAVSLLIAVGDGKTHSVGTPTDVDPPEDFKPIVTSDPNIFDGQHFLVFATQDKGVGIDHYEVREGWWGWFKNSDSPYLLNNQRLNKKIYVKAIDKSGNERLAMLPAMHRSLWDRYGLFAIILIMLIVLKKVWSKVRS